MVREGRAVNLVGAFEDAVTDRDGGYVKASCRSLAAYSRDVDDAYANKPTALLVTRVGEHTEALDSLGGERVSLDVLVAKVGELVRAAASEPV
jgi:CRISPR system Cascade subunit CasC